MKNIKNINNINSATLILQHNGYSYEFNLIHRLTQKLAQIQDPQEALTCAKQLIARNIEVLTQDSNLLDAVFFKTIPEQQALHEIFLWLDLKKECKTVQTLRTKAAAKNIPKEKGIHYFNFQYHQNDLIAAFHIFREFGRWPSEIIHDRTIDHAFVTQSFIDETKRIIELDPSTTTISILKEITRIPKALMKHHQNLTGIYASKNKICYLPRWIGVFQKLKTFNLFDNKITEIPNSLIDLKKLKNFYISENPLFPLKENLALLLTMPSTFSVCYMQKITRETVQSYMQVEKELTPLIKKSHFKDRAEAYFGTECGCTMNFCFEINPDLE